MSARDLIRLARPRQWTKNLAVFAAVVFAGKLTNLADVGITLAGFVVFCLVSSSLYAVNDIVDAERDRQHPIKRDRPVASGRVSAGVAVGFAAALGAVGLAIAALLGAMFAAVAVAYVLIHLLYSFGLKNIAIVDLLIIASGFMLRAVGGAVAIQVPVSPWLILCTGLLALFLVAAKRRHEIVLLREVSDTHRPALAQYSAELLDSFMVTLSAATISAYALYTFFEQRAANNLMMLTIPFVIYGVLRYQYLVLNRHGGGSPEEVLLGDVPILVDVVLWVLSAVAVLYVVPRVL